jgi:hypothetical protein
MLFVTITVFACIFCLSLAVMDRWLAPVLDKKRRLQDIKKQTAVQVQGGSRKNCR